MLRLQVMMENFSNVAWKKKTQNVFHSSAYIKNSFRIFLCPTMKEIIRRQLLSSICLLCFYWPLNYISFDGNPSGTPQENNIELFEQYLQQQFYELLVEIKCQYISPLQSQSFQEHCNNICLPSKTNRQKCSIS